LLADVRFGDDRGVFTAVVKPEDDIDECLLIDRTGETSSDDSHVLFSMAAIRLVSDMVIQLKLYQQKLRKKCKSN